MLFVVCSDVSATQKIGCFRVPKIIPRNGLFTQIEPISQKFLPLLIFQSLLQICVKMKKNP